MLKTNQLSNSSIVAATDNQISSDVGDETIVLELGIGNYYGLDEVGSLVWQLVQQPIAIEDLRDKILEEYDVSVSQCQTDLHQLLNKLIEFGLLELRETID